MNHLGYRSMLEGQVPGGAVIDVYRARISPYTLTGRVVQVSERLLVLHKVDKVSRLDGLVVVCLADVTRVVVGGRGLQIDETLADPAPVGPLPRACLTSVGAALAVLAEMHPLVGIYREALGRHEPLVGALRSLDRDFMVVDSRGPVESREVVSLRGVTRIDVDDADIRWRRRMDQLENGSG